MDAKISQMNKIIFLFFALFTVTSCFNDGDYEKLKGEWVCASWFAESDGKDMCNDNVHFTFKMDKTYSSQFNTTKEAGTFYLVGNVLYVTPNGKTEFGVEIKRLDTDTMTILMNRSGSAETLVLVKK